MRAAPGTDSAVVVTIPAGWVVIVHGRFGAWYQVSSAEGTGIEGWMAEEVLDLSPEQIRQIPRVRP